MLIIWLIIILISISVATLLTYFDNESKKLEDKMYEVENNIKQKEIQEMRSFADVGDSFFYLGVKMKVVSVYDYVITDPVMNRTTSYRPARILYNPTYTCNYVNSHGLVETMKFPYSMLDVIRQNNAEITIYKSDWPTGIL